MLSERSYSVSVSVSPSVQVSALLSLSALAGRKRVPAAASLIASGGKRRLARSVGRWPPVPLEERH